MRLPVVIPGEGCEFGLDAVRHWLNWGHCTLGSQGRDSCVLAYSLTTCLRTQTMSMPVELQQLLRWLILKRLSKWPWLRAVMFMLAQN